MSLFQGVYGLVLRNQTISGAHELFEVTAPSDRSVTILRATLSLATSTTPLDEIVETDMGVVTVSGNGTAKTPQPFNPNYAAVAATATGDGTTGPTLSPVFIGEGFHAQQGFRYLPLPEERPVFAGSDVFGWRIPSAITSSNWTWTLVFGVG